MFYDAFGALIGQSGDALETRQESPSDDPRFQREGRQISTFLRRTRAIWPDLFTTLHDETEALERGLSSLSACLELHGLAPAPSGSPSDPLERYRGVNRALDEAITRLAPHASEPWAKQALRSIRVSLAEASEIQGRLVDRMLEIR